MCWSAVCRIPSESFMQLGEPSMLFLAPHAPSAVLVIPQQVCSPWKFDASRHVSGCNIQTSMSQWAAKIQCRCHPFGRKALRQLPRTVNIPLRTTCLPMQMVTSPPNLQQSFNEISRELQHRSREPQHTCWPQVMISKMEPCPADLIEHQLSRNFLFLKTLPGAS